MSDPLHPAWSTNDLGYPPLESLGKALFLEVASGSHIDHASGTSSAVEPLAISGAATNDVSVAKLHPVQIAPLPDASPIQSCGQDPESKPVSLTTDLHSYPPAPTVSVVVAEVGHESTFQRRFRMSTCFLALFLAGWKLVH